MKQSILKKPFIVINILLIWVVLCAFAIPIPIPGINPTTTLDIEKKIVYQNYSITEINNDFTGNLSKAKNKYHNKHLVISGTVESIKDNAKGITIKDKSDQELRFVITATDSSVIETIAELSVGDTVKVYALSKVQELPIKQMNFTAEKIIKSNKSTSNNTVYETDDGTFIDKGKALKRTLGKSQEIQYYIKSDWKEIESELKDNENCNIGNGFQYKLNELPNSFNKSPEQLYVFYFMNELYLKDLNDRKSTYKIERSIIKNIQPNQDISGFPTKTIKKNGINYNFYVSSFIAAGGKGYNLEYVFIPVLDEGICVLLYVFNESIHEKDIINLLELIEVKK